jgi:hypothetical protein
MAEEEKQLVSAAKAQSFFPPTLECIKNLARLAHGGL